MSLRTLILTPWMTPHKIVSWERAVVLSFLGKVEILEEYDEEIRSPSLTIMTPAVVRLKKAMRNGKRPVRFSRMNVFTRDGFRCQYCGDKKDMRALNYDHVVPRMHGGQTVWDNIVTSCYACNDKKGGRSPEEAGMKLLRKPFKPKTLPTSFMLGVDRRTVPSQWEPYCGESALAYLDVEHVA